MDILGKYHGNIWFHQWYIGVLFIYELLAAWFLMASSLELPLLQPLCEERFALLQGHLWVPETHQQHLRCRWFWRHQNLANKIKQLGSGDVGMQTNAHFVWGLKDCADISTVLGDVRVQCLQASKFGGLEWMRQAVSRRQDGWGCPQYHEVSTELQYAWSRRDVAPAGLTFVPTPSPLSFHILTIHLDWKGPGSILIHKWLYDVLSWSDISVFLDSCSFQPTSASSCTLGEIPICAG